MMMWRREEEGVSGRKVDVLRKLKAIKDITPEEIDCEFRRKKEVGEVDGDGRKKAERDGEGPTAEILAL